MQKGKKNKKTKKNVKSKNLSKLADMLLDKHRETLTQSILQAIIDRSGLTVEYHTSDSHIGEPSVHDPQNKSNPAEDRLPSLHSGGEDIIPPEDPEEV